MAIKDRENVLVLVSPEADLVEHNVLHSCAPADRLGFGVRKQTAADGRPLWDGLQLLFPQSILVEIERVGVTDFKRFLHHSAVQTVLLHALVVGGNVDHVLNCRRYDLVSLQFFVDVVDELRVFHPRVACHVQVDDLGVYPHRL